MDTPTALPPKTFTVVTTAQVERTYIIQARDEEQAHARLHQFLKDPDAVREGVVVEQREKQVDATTQRIKSKAATKPA